MRSAGSRARRRERGPPRWRTGSNSAYNGSRAEETGRSSDDRRGRAGSRIRGADASARILREQEESGLLQDPEQMLLNFLLPGAENGTPGNDQNAAWQDPLPVQPERFGDQPSCTVPHDGRMMQFAAANDAVPGYPDRAVRRRRLDQYREKRVPAGFPVFLERIEILSGAQFFLLPQAAALNFHGAVLQMTVRRLRPFALLLASTRRPPLVAILARNPYLRARFTTEG